MGRSVNEGSLFRVLFTRVPPPFAFLNTDPNLEELSGCFHSHVPMQGGLHWRVGRREVGVRGLGYRFGESRV